MNRTIYLPDEEAETWEKARKLANDRLSPVILRGLKEYIMTKEAAAAEAAGFKRIEVEFEDSNDSDLLKRKAFRGRWIIPPREPFPPAPAFELPSKRRVYAVALTAKANVVVYSWVEEPDFDHIRAHSHIFMVFQSFEQAARDPNLNYAIREAVKRRGVPVEELDI